MGCDGGTIPKRDELVRTKKKPEQKDKDAELSYRWRHCSINQQPLQKPIVACQLGRLYSKTSVLEGLLDRTTLPETATHIKSLKDVKDLQLTPNPAFSEGAEKGDGYVDRQCSPFICPVIGLEMNGKFKFCFLWTCGCVMSERAIKSVKDKIQMCHKCQKQYEDEDIVILNAANEDLDVMTERMMLRQQKMKAEKKAKKAKVKSESGEGGSDTQALQNGGSEAKKNGVNGAYLAFSYAFNGTGKRPMTTCSQIPNPEMKKTKTDYSVAEDPNASSVFKSLFTSHKNAKQQTRAHWVTYNPFYN
ncbi:replication termination factor 2 [Nilaparvata lugens]|uniref:replication termination factor 2 n=1 Tax=Nilaparvata lugens TaxID=108931 RepID=UPI00193E42C4|nr:replication termination factor 2 [Nilaparvata lugens]